MATDDGVGQGQVVIRKVLGGFYVTWNFGIGAAVCRTQDELFDLVGRLMTAEGQPTTNDKEGE